MRLASHVHCLIFVSFCLRSDVATSLAGCMLPIMCGQLVSFSTFNTPLRRQVFLMTPISATTDLLPKFSNRIIFMRKAAHKRRPSLFALVKQPWWKHSICQTHPSRDCRKSVSTARWTEQHGAKHLHQAVHSKTQTINCAHCCHVRTVVLTSIECKGQRHQLTQRNTC